MESYKATSAGHSATLLGMSRRTSTLKLTALLGSAVCALMAGHLVQYQLLTPVWSERTQLLQSTGHSYLPWALHMAAFLGLAAVGATSVLGVRRGRSQLLPFKPLHSVFKVAAFQVGCFLLLETMERVLAGAPLDHLTTRVLLISSGIQVAFAALSVLCLMVVDALASAIVRIASSKRHPQPRHEWIPLLSTPHPSQAPYASNLCPRGPPTFLSIQVP